MPISILTPGNPTTWATWRNPQRNGDLREWYDATNRVKRMKKGSDPTSETDGTMVMEAE